MFFDQLQLLESWEKSLPKANALSQVGGGPAVGNGQGSRPTSPISPTLSGGPPTFPTSSSSPSSLSSPTSPIKSDPFVF